MPEISKTSHVGTPNIGSANRPKIIVNRAMCQHNIIAYYFLQIYELLPKRNIYILLIK